MERPCLFLDAGGVLLDEAVFEALHAEVICELLRERGLDYGLEDYWRDAEEAVRLYVPRVYAWILWRRGPEEAWYHAALREEKRRWRERHPPMTLMAGLGDVLPELAGACRLGILGQYGRELVERLEEAGLTRHFSFLSTQDEFTLTKPDPRYFEQVLGAAGVQASHSIMVGDRIDKDVIPARQVGMRIIRVRTGLHRNQEPRIPEERPDAEVSRLEELPAAVARLLDAKSVPV